MSGRDDAAFVSRRSGLALVGLGVLSLGGLALWAGSAAQPWVLFTPKHQWMFAYLPLPMLGVGVVSLGAGLVTMVVVSARRA